MKMSRFVVADAGKVAGTTALSSPVGAHGPVEEFATAHDRIFQINPWAVGSLRMEIVDIM